MAYSFIAKCVRRYPQADKTEPGQHKVKAGLAIVDDETVGLIDISTVDKMVGAYLQDGKSYRITIQLAPNPEKA